MQLNLTTVYAVRCMTYLAEHPEGLCSREISEEISVDREFTLKILRKLKNAGLVHATKGSTGGYRLARQAKDIPLWQIIAVTEDSMAISRSLEPDYTTYISSNNYRRETNLYSQMQHHIDSFLNRLDLQSIVDDRVAMEA